MDDYIRKAIILIGNLDFEIQELIKSAAADRAYEQLTDLAWFGEQIKNILEKTKSYSKQIQKNEINKQIPDSKKIKQKKPRFDFNKEKSNKIFNSRSMITFPLFVRDGDSLVKIGLSTNTESTYEHRASRKTIDDIVRRILKCNKRDIFSAEMISDIHHLGDGKKVPGYQLYLCLGWLKKLDLLKQRGRKGYILTNPDTIASDIDKEWDNLKNINNI